LRNNIQKTNRPKLIECFCGAGGLALGFVRAGFETIYAFDNDSACVNTYTSNLGYHSFVRDATQVTKKSIEKDLGYKLPEIDVVSGGPPCQGFSVQRRGDDNDSRNNLVLEFIRLVCEIMPKYFVMENVGGLLSIRGRTFLAEIAKKCLANNYRLHIAKLNAFEYGVPQIRKRVILVGESDSNNPSFTFPDPNRDKIKKPLTVRDAIYDLMDKNEKDVPNHKADRLSEINLKRIRSLKPGQSRDSLPEELQLNCHINNSTHRHLDVYGRMSWDFPSPTITARFDSFSRGKFGHPELNRSITLREGARLQTFPDYFKFAGTKVEVAKQIGNAVPPLLALALGKQILKYLNNR
jgi:DNA (cytosine-5)-methyltransferase 1